MLAIPEIGLTIEDLVGGNSAHINEYLKIYEELLPQYMRYAPVMRKRAERPLDPTAIEQWHQWLLFIKGYPVGIIGILYNRKRNAGILLDFAICPSARGIQYGEHKRLAGLILYLAMQQLVRDAQASGREHPLYMLAEVEHAALVKKYYEYGYIEFPVEYYEPPYTPELAEQRGGKQNFEKMDYARLFLGAFQIPGYPFTAGDPLILQTAIFTLLEDHYQLPADHWLLKNLCNEISTISTIGG